MWYGVRQGDNLAPVFFTMYLNDLNESTKGTFQSLQMLDNDTKKQNKKKLLETFMRLYVLLYAEDTIIFAETADEFRDAHNDLSEYCTNDALK